MAGRDGRRPASTAQPHRGGSGVGGGGGQGEVARVGLRVEPSSARNKPGSRRQKPTFQELSDQLMSRLARKSERQQLMTAALYGQQERILQLPEQQQAMHEFKAYHMTFLEGLAAPIRGDMEIALPQQARQTRVLQLNPIVRKKKEKAKVAAPLDVYEETVLGGISASQHFDPTKDARDVRRALKGWGTNDSNLIVALGSRTLAQRLRTAQAYNAAYKRDLVKDLCRETSGHFEKLLRALMMPPDEFAAYSVHKAVKGLGTKDKALMEVLCTSTPEQIVAMKAAYLRLYSKDMETAVRGDVSGQYGQFLMALLAAKRDPEGEVVNRSAAMEDARELYNAGEVRVGTDEAVFIDMLANRSFSHLRAVFTEYDKLVEYDIEKSIAREMSFHLKDALVTTVQGIRTRHSFFARRLHKAAKGLGTSDSTLIRVIVAHAEDDLLDIAEKYQTLYGQSLERLFKQETTGSYMKLLLELLGNGSFNADRDAKTIRKALKGWGTNEHSLSRVLSQRLELERVRIRVAYERNYHRKLNDDFASELSGAHRDLCLALINPVHKFLAAEIHEAVQGFGTDDTTLIEILCTRTGFEMRQLKVAYKRLYGSELITVVAEETSGDYKALLEALVDAERDDKEAVDEDLAKKEASKLYRAGEARIGTDEEALIDVLTTHSFRQTRAILRHYSKLCDYDFEKSIARETSSNFKRALLTIVRVVRLPPLYFAFRLHQAMKGLGTRERALNRILVMRCNLDLKLISEFYFKVFKRTLEIAVEKELGGAYKKLVLMLLDFARHTQGPDQPDEQGAGSGGGRGGRRRATAGGDGGGEVMLAQYPTLEADPDAVYASGAYDAVAVALSRQELAHASQATQDTAPAAPPSKDKGKGAKQPQAPTPTADPGARS